VSIALGVVIYVWCSSSFAFYGKGTPIPFTPTERPPSGRRWVRYSVETD